MFIGYTNKYNYNKRGIRETNTSRTREFSNVIWLKGTYYQNAEGGLSDGRLMSEILKIDEYVYNLDKDVDIMIKLIYIYIYIYK